MARMGRTLGPMDGSLQMRQWAARHERGPHGNSLQVSTSDIRLEDIATTSMARQSSVSVWESPPRSPCGAASHHARRASLLTRGGQTKDKAGEAWDRRKQSGKGEAASEAWAGRKHALGRGGAGGPSQRIDRSIGRYRPRVAARDLLCRSGRLAPRRGGAAVKNGGC
jgi:hypothetical protein